MTPAAAVPAGWCQCGCGERTNPAHQTNRSKNIVKGQPARFIHGHHRRLRRNAAATGAVDVLDLQSGQSAPPVSPWINSVPPGIRRAVHLKFLAVVERAFKRERLPASIFRPDREDDEIEGAAEA